MECSVALTAEGSVSTISVAGLAGTLNPRPLDVTHFDPSLMASRLQSVFSFAACVHQGSSGLDLKPWKHEFVEVSTVRLMLLSQVPGLGPRILGFRVIRFRSFRV